MNKYLFLILAFFSSLNLYAQELTKDYQNYKLGMEFYGKQQLESAEPLLVGIIKSDSISDDQKIYASIAISDIYESSNRLDDAVTILEKTWNSSKKANEAKRDLGLVLSKIYRLHKVGKIFRSYKVASYLFNQFPNDESVLFNFSVANLYMAGLAAEKKELDQSIKKYFDEAIKDANQIIATSKNKEFVGASYNLIGLADDRQGNYSSAVTNFNKAIEVKEKAIYHRNLGWALYGGVAKKLKGVEKLKVIKQAYDEFNLAIKNGDDDTVTRQQLPNIEKLLNIHPKK